MTQKIAVATAALLSIVGIAVAQAPPNKPAVPGIGDQIPSFKVDLIAVGEKAESTTAFDSAAATKPVVYVVLGTRCPSSQAYSERMAKLDQKYSKKADFIYVYPNREDDREAKIAFHRQKKLGGKVIDDKEGRVAKQLGAQRTTEVFLADAKGKLVFHGGIDDNRDNPAAVTKTYVATAIDETLEGRPVTTTTSQVFA